MLVAPSVDPTKERYRRGLLSLFEGGDLVDAALVATPLEGRGKPQLDDLVSQAGGHNACPDGKDVGVVVLPRHPRGVQVVAQRRPHPRDLVGSDLFPLTAAAQHDAPISLPT